MTNEVLQAIRVIKFYAWERQFRTKINDVRLFFIFYFCDASTMQWCFCV